MQNTLSIFNDRNKEIEFYFLVMVDINNENTNIHTADNTRFYKILKSNFLLMLYNLVEACIVSGMMEIYESLRNDGCSYNQVIQEIQKIWLKNKINEIYGPTTIQIAYENRVKQIIHDITINSPIILSKNALGISGNLNAKKIKDVCDKHRIRYHLNTKGESLELVKRGRNNLAHGDVSFSDCARELTINDLENIKNEVILFLKDILDGMKNYYEQKSYKLPTAH